MRGLKGFLLVLLVVLVAVAAGGTVLLRSQRGKIDRPSEIKPNLLLVTNAVGVDVFAARVAPGSNVVLFDAGLDPEGHPIDALLVALAAKRDDVADVFLTHAHFDHLGGVPLVPKARVHLGAADVPLATGLVPPDALLPRLLGFALSAKPVSINAPIPGNAPTEFPVGPADAAGKQKVVKAFPVPGHTPGSYAYLYDGVLIVGDIMLFKQGRLELPPSVFDPHPDQNKASIRALTKALASETLDVVCTAHGGCTPSGLGRNLLDDLTSRIGR
jgi:hydroxyacylglutathione hydrolase